MFKSKARPITIPQSEHARLAGHIASVWGNADVDPPPLDLMAFTSGVTHHDRGYGLLDTMPIGEVDEAIWLATQRRGILTPLSDATADTVALMHILRLLSRSESKDAPVLVALAEQHIERNIPQMPYTRQNFEQANDITNLCDMVSFVFCFEEQKEFDMPVYSQAEGGPQSIHITIGAGGHIQLEPWPLSVPALQGFIIGYELAGYPDHPQPVLVEYAITP